MAKTAQTQYIIESAIFTADRRPDLPIIKPLDLSGSIAELNIFESMELPYLTGTCALVDDVRFRDSVGIKGSERITFTILEKENATPIIKTFMITGVAASTSANERTEVHMLTLMEEHAYLSSVMKISQSYTGNPEQIIINILNSHLGKVLRPNAAIALQQKMKVNIPYWNPLQATEWLRDRMSSSLGAPYFLYASLRDDLIRLEDLDNMMKKDAWNKLTPYSYSQTSHNSSQISDTRAEYFHIKSYKATQIESTLRLAQGGAIGSEFKTMDLTSASQTQNSRHNSNTTLNSFIKSIESNADLNSSIGYDWQLSFQKGNSDFKNIGDLNSKVFSEVVASRKFYDTDGITPIAGYADEHKQEALYKLKIKSAALRAILLNNVYEIEVPGQPYLVGDLNIGVGSNISLNYAVASQADGSILSGDVDRNKSGKFLVYRTRHKFTEGMYDLKMDIVKLTDKTGEA
jgi:hypothetical protein